MKRGPIWGRLLVLAGLGLLALWALRPSIASLAANNLGSLALNRALLAPGMDEEQRWALGAQAGRSFQTALAWDPLNGPAYNNLATVYDLWEDAPSAARAAARAAVLNPHDASTRFRLGQALAAGGLERQATEAWRAAGAAPYFVNQGRALARTGDYAGALAAYERALAIDPDVPEGYYRQGQALSALGRKEAAVAALEAAAALEPELSVQRYLLQGEVHVARGEWVAALAAFGRAAGLDPRDPEPHYRMGRVREQGLGDRDAAAAHFARALQLDPDHVSSRLTLGRLAGEQGDCDEAVRWLAPFLASAQPSPGGADWTDAEASALVGICLMRQEQGDPDEADEADEAVPYLERAAALDPRSVRYQLVLAQGYSRAGRYHDAIGAYLRVLELAPDNAQALQALQELGWVEP